MKKLALALVCLISVAFFASCTPEGQPTINVLPGDEYVHDGDIINVNEEFNIGFAMASSLETGSQLASFTLVIDDETFETVTLEGTEYTFERTLALNTVDTRDDIDNLVITGTVTDVLGQSASVTMTLILDETQELIVEDFEWKRDGSNPGTGLEAFGLAWTSNVKEVHAVIQPKDKSVKLYQIPAEKWAEVTTQPEKVALFADGGVAVEIDNYKGVSAEVPHDDYNDVIATLYNGEYYLIHITKGEVTYDNATHITITGEWK